MSWIIEAPNNNPSVFVLISSTVFQIDGDARVGTVRADFTVRVTRPGCPLAARLGADTGDRTGLRAK
jgi:hypothetical protein